MVQKWIEENQLFWVFTALAICYITQEKTRPLKRTLIAVWTTVSLSLYITWQIIHDAGTTAKSVPIV